MLGIVYKWDMVYMLDWVPESDMVCTWGPVAGSGIVCMLDSAPELGTACKWH